MDTRNSSGSVAPPTLEQWATLLAPACLAHRIPLPFALKWIDIESGGNPCAIGYPPARGPDGQPREIGIAQLYNPDDLQRLKLTGAQLRAYCVPGDDHTVTFKGRVVRGFSSSLLRSLTAREMQEQVDAAVDLITRAMSTATSDLMAVNAGEAWSRSRRDYWSLVKLQHGLPGLSRSGLPAVARKLGRAPRGWQEFKATLDLVQLDHETERYRNEFSSILNNAERCASVVAELELG